MKHPFKLRLLTVLFEGGDGNGIVGSSNAGTIELFVWSESTLTSNTTSTMSLNQSVSGSDMHTTLDGVGSEDITLTRGWVSTDSH